MFARWIAPLGTAFGLTPEAIISLIFGFFAKEVVIDVLYVLFGSKGAILASMTWVQAYSLMLFMLFYTPCVATLATIYNETKSKKFTLFVILEGFILGALFSFAFYNLANLLGVGT